MWGASRSTSSRLGAYVVALALVCLGLAFADSASADTFCVAPTPKQSSECTKPTSEGLQVALDAAGHQAGYDRILIGPGVFSDGPFCYTVNDPLEIIGDGAGKTVLTMTRPADPCDPSFPPFPLPVPGLNPLPQAVLTLSNGGLSAYLRTAPAFPLHHLVSNLGIEIPNVENEAGMALEGAFANDVDVTADPNAVDPTGVVTQGIDASFVSGSVTLSVDGSVGLRAESLATLITRSRITALSGVLSKGMNFFGSSSSVSIYSSVIVIADAQPSTDVPAVGLRVFAIQGASSGDCTPDDPGSILLQAINLTVYGSVRHTDTGVELRTDSGTAGSVGVFSSVLDNVGVSLAIDRKTTGGLACIRSNYSSHAPVEPDEAIIVSNLVPGPPKFVSPEAGDFHLMPDSPLIDRGNPLPLNRLEPPLDADHVGKPRILDGKIAPGDTGCVPRRDVGAFEFDPMTVLARASVAPEAVAGRAVEFDASTSCAPNPDSVLSYTWSFDDGGTASGVRVLHTFTTPGEHQATVTVNNSDGYQSSVPVSVLVRPAPAGGLGAQADDGIVTAKDRNVPRARRLDIRPRAFRAAGAGASIARSVGAFVRYRLSEPAKVRFTVQRVKRGRGGRARFARLRGSFTHSGRKDSNKFRFTGRLAQKKLRPGRYRLVGVPTDGAGNRGRAVRATFRITAR